MTQRTQREGNAALALGAFSREAVVTISQSRGEPEWVRQKRLAAWEVFERTPMPTLQDEGWRRTDISERRLDQVRPSAEAAPPTAVDRLPAELRTALGDLSESSGYLVQQDSGVTVRQLDPTLARQGVVLSSLEEAVRDHPDLVRKYFMTESVSPLHNKFAALHGAFWSGGSFVYVPPDVMVELPIQSAFWLGPEGPGMFNHTLVVVDRGASVTYVDQLLSPAGEDQAFASGVAELLLLEGAQLRYVHLQRWGENVWNFSTQRAVLGRDSVLNSLIVALGSKLTKASVDSVLNGQGASAEMLGLFVGGGSQVLDHHTLQDHRAPHTTSDLLYKGALRDRARSVFSGLIRIHPGAQRTDAYQANRNLLLSPTARADSIPNLEIQANDVRCTHGATVSPVDEEQLFYLMSRGLPRAEAQHMIVEGFFEPVMARIPLDRVREQLAGLIGTKIGF